LGRILPSPALGGGLWIASRDALATRARVLHLGVSRVFFLVILFFALLSLSNGFPASCKHTRTHEQNRQTNTGRFSAMSRLAVPLHCLRKLLVNLSFMEEVEEAHQRVAPFVRAPQRLQVSRWEK